MTNTVKWGVMGSGGIARRSTISDGIVLAACYQPAKTGKLDEME